MFQGSHSRRIARDSLGNYKNHAHFPGQKHALTHVFFYLKMSVINLERAIDPFKCPARFEIKQQFSAKKTFFDRGENRKFTLFTDCWHIGCVYYYVNHASALSGPRGVVFV